MKTNEKQVKERPIIFSTDMVRAILDGKKTMTRRVVKSKYDISVYKDVDFDIDGDGQWELSSTFELNRRYSKFKCPYGKVGDRLWVRETFTFCFECDIPKGRPVGAIHTMGSPARPNWKSRVVFKADGDMPNVQWRFVGDSHPVTWQSPLSMERKYSRILLEITDIRVERLQDISEADAVREGICSYIFDIEDHPPNAKGYTHLQHDDGKSTLYKTAILAFKNLWDSLYEKNSPKRWVNNPWVWVVEFKVVEGA